MNSRSYHVGPWLSQLQSQAGIRENHACPWVDDPSATLIAKAAPGSFYVGNGLQIFEEAIAPAIESAEQEVIFVTCFWAPSHSLTCLSAALVRLSQKATARADGSRIRVRLCFSSRSLVQKLFHTSSPNGYLYPPGAWTAKLGLPPHEQLRGLDLRVKSLFFRPFSVMHPKFLIVDRHKVLMPSCNVSWESWYECCLSTAGPTVDSLLLFWHHYWERGERETSSIGFTANDHSVKPGSSSIAGAGEAMLHRLLPIRVQLPATKLPVILLPSPHHADLRLSVALPFISTQAYPLTPLNTMLVQLFSKAIQSIDIITPNVTSPPVLKSLLEALQRGVNVSIVTNRRMMIVEQLLTASTITELCMWKLIRSYQKMRDRLIKVRADGHQPRRTEEGRIVQDVGSLRVAYYKPRYSQGDGSEPVKSHVKCTVIDNEIIVLGSGNMDRASWYTSQELGIMLQGKDVATTIHGALQAGLKERTQDYYGECTG